MLKRIKLTIEQLKTIRRKTGLSQEEFGKVLDLSRNSIVRRECGAIDIDQQFARAVKNIEDDIK